MKKQIALAVLLMSCSLAHAQQYVWVRVAQIGSSSNLLRSVTFVDSLHGWVAGATTGFHYTTDGGSIWFPGSGATVVPYSISMLNTSIGWAAGSSGSFGGIHKTINGGISWTQQRYLINRNYLGTASLTLGKNITSGSTYDFFPDTGKLVTTTNGGSTWTERTIADSIQQLRKVQFVDSLHGWIAAIVSGQPGGVLRTTNGGASWSLHIVAVFSGISFIDTLHGWGITPGRSLFRTTDGGVTWQFLGGVGTQDEDLSAASISFVDSSYGWVFGTIFYQGDLAAAIYRTTDGGLSWTRELAGGGSRGVGGMMLDRRHGWAVGSLGAVFAYRIVSSVPERLERVPKSFALKQNYPNPFNPATTIEYEVMQQSHVTITVYDINGREVRQLLAAKQEQGAYRIHFDATGLASGTYYYTMKTESFTESKQMIFVK